MTILVQLSGSVVECGKGRDAGGRLCDEKVGVRLLGEDAEPE